MHADRAGRVGEDLRKRGFAAAGRAPKDQRLELARFSRASQNLPRPEQMILTDEFLDLGRPHALRQRLR